MAKAVYVPRLNSNDDEMVVVNVFVKPGDQVKKGEALLELETSKTVIEVESEESGFILKIDCNEADVVQVGSVVAWIGASCDEPEPVATPIATSDEQKGPTLKALKLLEQYSLKIGDIPFSGDRLTAEDVERHVKSAGSLKTAPMPSLRAQARAVDDIAVPYSRKPLSGPHRGMVETVQWHRDIPAHTYLEVIYNQAVWKEYAADFAKTNKMMMSPLLGLMAYRLVRLAVEYPSINATIDSSDLLQYETVNLGFTIEASGQLYLLVVENAQQYSATEFLNRLAELQRKAFKRDLKKNEMTGATVTFTSLANRGVSRHLPILPPHSALIVSHSAPQPFGKTEDAEFSTLGATYDHRVLDGAQTAQILNLFAVPPSAT